MAASAPEFVVVLSDSTAYGWLGANTPEGQDFVVRNNRKLFAAVCCGGAVLKPGKGGPGAKSAATLTMEWLLGGASALVPAKTPLVCRAIPARRSVPQREYVALEKARSDFGVLETATPILDVEAASYYKRQLHFKADVAAAAMERIVQLAVQEASAAVGGPPAATWIAVVVCAGWNCQPGQILSECHCVADLTRSTTWDQFLGALNRHSPLRFPYVESLRWLGEQVWQLLQTNKQDHGEAEVNQRTFGGELFERKFVGDQECIADVRGLGGDSAEQHYLSFSKASHRSDLWRYIRLVRDGGSYMDIKMALLQPLVLSFDRVYADGNRMQEAKNLLAQTGKRTLADLPHLMLSIGANGAHIYQGNIFGARRNQPLLVRAINDHFGTSNAKAVGKGGYLTFCQFLWRELITDLNNSTPVEGWNFGATYGPVYLFRERLQCRPRRGQHIVQARGEQLKKDAR